MFRGSLVALVTPMEADGTISVESLRRLVEWHIENQTDAFVVLGTTGESATLDWVERRLVIEQTLEQVNGRVPVIAGTGVNSTRESIHLTQQAMELGVDACLLITPYYLKPTQEGLYLHFKAIAESVPIPQILYNVPSRTACDLLPQTVVRLADVANIIGVKDATGDISRVQNILEHCNGKLDLYSGDDATALEFILAGGKGVISVTANIAPKETHDFCLAALQENKAVANELNHRLMPLHKKLFVESNPIPVKWALHQMGLIPPGIRLPLTLLSAAQHPVVQEAMQQAKIERPIRSKS
ncbi:MAG: 4-hydroxy-tetrahydrodipicolinate synthase [Gammaproteobacteria bacterium]